MPREVDMVARDGDNLLHLLRDAGLAVSAPCGGEGLAYHYGDRTITYTACVLF